MLEICLLNKQMNRESFASTSVELNQYLHTRALQDMKRRIASCFCAIDEAEPTRIIGYYTLSATSIYIDELPDELSKKLPRYPTIPAFLLGRLAVDKQFAGQGYGGLLLVDALHRCCQNEISAYALVLVAKDEQAMQFYQHYGFMSFPEQSDKMFLPLKTFLDALKS